MNEAQPHPHPDEEIQPPATPDSEPRTEVTALMQSMADTVDWDAVMAQSDLDAALYLPRLYRNGVPASLDTAQLGTLLEYLQKVRDQFGRPEAQEVAPGPAPEIRPTPWMEATRRAARMAADSRRREISGKLNRISWMAENLEPTPEHDPLPMRVYSAVLSRFADEAEQIDDDDAESVAEWHRQDVRRTDEVEGETRTRHMALMIAGSRRLGERLQLDDPEAWVNRRLNRMPRAWTSGLSVLQFDDKFTVRDKEYSDGGGLMDHATMFAGVQPPDWEHNVPAARQFVVYTLYHEIAHRAHFTQLPMGVLRQWIEIADSEPVDLTNYVSKNRHDAAAVSAGRADWEDFAESVALYMTKPGEIATRAPMRFEFINKLIGRYPLFVPSREIDIDAGKLTRQLLADTGDAELAA